MDFDENKNIVASENILAIIIGVKEYDDPGIPNLEAADNNAHEFRKVLKRRKFSVSAPGATETKPGVPDSNIFKRTDGATDAMILREEINSFLAKSIASNPKIELILIYYSGHGAFDVDKGKYYLSVRKTKRDDFKYTSLAFDVLFETVDKYKRRLVFIIDSCFSENAFNSISSKHDFFLMASSAQNLPARYPLEDEYSAFTKRLLEAVLEGIKKNGKVITLNELYETTKSRLKSDGFPEPKCLEKNGAGKLIFDVNNFVNEEESAVDYDSLIKNGITRIFKSLFPNAAIDTKKNEKVLASFPVLISVYLKGLLASNKKAPGYPYFLDFYKQLVSFLAFIFIKDLTSTTKKVEENDYLQLRDWREKHPENSHELYINILRMALGKYRGQLYISELQGDNLLLSRLEETEKWLISPDQAEFDPFVNLLFSLIAELAFFKQYALISVRFIDVKKGYYGTLCFSHEVSRLYGPEPERYRQGLESKNDSLNNAVILIRTSLLDKELTDSIQTKSFVNLWPFMIDEYCNYKEAKKPNLCILSSVERAASGNRYFYRSILLKKEREVNLEYTDMPVYPAIDELHTYSQELMNNSKMYG